MSIPSCTEFCAPEGSLSVAQHLKMSNGQRTIAYTKNLAWLSTTSTKICSATLVYKLCESPRVPMCTPTNRCQPSLRDCMHSMKSHSAQIWMRYGDRPSRDCLLTLVQAQSVVDAAKKTPQLKVMAGFSRRFDASYRDAAVKTYEKKSIGDPFVIRSNTCYLMDNTGFFVRYASRHGGTFVDCAIHDIDLSLWYLGNPVPKAFSATGTLQHHPKPEQYSDVDNAVGVVEFYDSKIAYFYCSRNQAHAHDVCTEITGTKGKAMINVMPRANNVVLADNLGMRKEVQPEYWQRFEDASALEANEFVESIVKDTPVPLPTETGITVMKIGRALQEALTTGKVVRFDKEGNQRANVSAP